MKYKLLKDLPGAKAGEEFEISSDGTVAIDEHNYYVKYYPDFFEPLPETPVRWTPKFGEKYWEVDYDMKPHWFNSLSSFIHGENTFRTEQQAQAVADAFNSVLAYVHEPSSGYDDLQTLNDDFNKLASLARYAVQGDV